MNRLGFLVFFYKLEEVLACDGIASCLLPAVLIFDETAFDIEPCGQLADMADQAYLLHRQCFGQVFQFELLNFHGGSLSKILPMGSNAVLPLIKNNKASLRFAGFSRDMERC